MSPNREWSQNHNVRSEWGKIMVFFKGKGKNWDVVKIWFFSLLQCQRSHFWVFCSRWVLLQRQTDIGRGRGPGEALGRTESSSSLTDDTGEARQWATAEARLQQGPPEDKGQARQDARQGQTNACLLPPGELPAPVPSPRPSSSAENQLPVYQPQHSTQCCSYRISLSPTLSKTSSVNSSSFSLPNYAW